MPWKYLIKDLHGKEKELQKTIQKEFRIEKGDKLYIKWKAYDNPFNSWIEIKRKLSYFPESHPNKNKTEVELDLSNYSTKSDQVNTTGVAASQFSKKDDLVNLKSDADKLDFDKLKTTHVDLSKLNNVVNNHVVKKDV